MQQRNPYQQPLHQYGRGAYGAQRPQAGMQSDAREKFIVRTYNHLFGAILLFAAIEFGLFYSGLAVPIANTMLSVSWMLVLGAFMGISWIASRTARRSSSMGAQYLALGGFVLAEAILFVPLLVLAQLSAGGGVIQSAGFVTIAAFAGLTGIAFWTRKDFSFLGGILRWGFIIALVAIGAALIFGFTLGTFFSVAMVGLAGGSILYSTSNILLHYPEDRYVSAALELFSSVAMMFWYVLSLFSRR